MKATLIDSYTGENKVIASGDSWKEVSEKAMEYIKNHKEIIDEVYYTRLFTCEKGTRIYFGSHYYFIDVDIPISETLKMNPVDITKQKKNKKKEEVESPKTMTTSELLIKFKDLLTRADIQGSKIISKTEIRKLKEIIDKTLS